MPMPIASRTSSSPQADLRRDRRSARRGDRGLGRRRCRGNVDAGACNASEARETRRSAGRGISQAVDQTETQATARFPSWRFATALPSACTGLRGLRTFRQASPRELACSLAGLSSLAGARCYEEPGLAPGAQALEHTLRVLEARALAEELNVRRGVELALRPKRSTSIWATRAGAIAIAADGFEIIAGDALSFLRVPRMRPLCEPEVGYSIDELIPFANLASENDFVLVVAWLVAALRNAAPTLFSF